MNNDFDLGIVYSSAEMLAADMGQIVEQSQRAVCRRSILDSLLPTGSNLI